MWHIRYVLLGARGLSIVAEALNVIQKHTYIPLKIRYAPTLYIR